MTIPAYDFKGKVAVVTGGVQGIGRTIADALATGGAEVHVFDWAEPDSPIDGITCHKVDVSDSKSVQAAVDAIGKQVTLLVNNAGITRDKSIAKMSDDDWSSVIGVNLTGSFNTIRAMAPGMGNEGGGHIVNITSINGLRGKFGQANYTAAKGGLITLTKTAAREFGRKRVTVNAVAPGMVMTEMAKQLPQQYLDKALEETVINDLALPEDIANAVLFLLSDGARMITGEVIRVDAGQYI